MNKLKRIIPVVVVLLLCVVYGFALLGRAYIPTHDGEYHIIRFMEFFRMLHDGYLVPRWAPTLNSTYGLPLFNFHYPFPNYIGSFFHLFGIQFVDSFKLTLFSGYTLGILACFFWLRRLSTPAKAFYATIVVASIPYWFVDMYIRGSVGEVWAMAFVFVSLFFIESSWSVPLALSIAGVIVSHNILALLFLPIVGLYAWIRSKRSLVYIVWGVALSTYFWLPALAEKKYMVGLNSVGYKDHFVEPYELIIPSWGSGFSGLNSVGSNISFQLGIVPMMVSILALWQWTREKNKQLKKGILLVLVLYIAGLFLMHRSSESLWQLIPWLGYMQYPWRLLSVVIVLTACLCLYLFSKINRTWIMVLISLLSILFVFSYTRPVEYAPRDDYYYASRPNFTDGTSSLGNSLSTIWSPWKNVRPDGPVEFASGNGKMKIISNEFLDKQFSFELVSDSVIQINTLYFPGWEVREGKQLVNIDYTKNGTIQVPLAQGRHTIRVTFTETPIRKLADTVSLVSLLGLTVVGTQVTKKRKK